MDDIKTILERLENLDLDAYREYIARSMGMDGGLEGVPAIIGLSDLTNPDMIYHGAEMDTRMNQDMAMDAMVFSWLCDRMPDRDPHYPAIAPAMSALAQKSFVMFEDEDRPSEYLELLEKE